MAKSRNQESPVIPTNKITRYQVISECINIYSGIKRAFSQDGAYQQPLKGYEEAFGAVEQKLALLRDMLNEERYGKEAMDAVREKQA